MAKPAHFAAAGKKLRRRESYGKDSKLVCDAGPHRYGRKYLHTVQEGYWEDILENCFLPRYEEKRKIWGEWKILKKLLFPGYVFVISDDIDQLYQKLKKVIGLTKLIGTGKEIIPLTEEEVRLLMKFGGEEQIVAMSKGIIEGSKVIINSGPLKGMEGYIRKIDRHKRKAYLEVPMFNGMQNIQVGLEIVSKRI